MILKSDKDVLMERLQDIAKEIGVIGYWDVVQHIQDARRCLNRKHTSSKRKG